MRGSFGLFKNANGLGGATGIGNTTKIVSCSAFSTSSGGGSGGGRGRGGSSQPKFDFVSNNPGKTAEESENSDKLIPSAGVGRGRGKPLPSSSYLPSFNAFQTSQQTGIGRGRGGPLEQPPDSGNDQESKPKKPIFLTKDEATGASSVAETVSAAPRQPIGERDLPDKIVNVLMGSGRGKPVSAPMSEVGAKQENRHLRPRPAPASVGGAETRRGQERVESRDESRYTGKGPKMSQDEAVKKSLGILSRNEDRQVEGGGQGRGVGRGRGRGRGRGMGARGRGRRWRDDLDEEDDEDDKALYIGDDADGENFAKLLGPKMMNELTEAFEDMSSDVLPDPVEDEYIEALDTNHKIELEPEYLFGDFETNPDIDEKPPVSLPEALEKMKPFLVAYEGIETQEEWEELVKDAMERVPLLKEIVDHYSGPDRVTAKQQQGEFERVAKTLPNSAPNSVKRFTNRALLSLQSNPGWGFDRKCQFVDKLVDEVSKSYK